MASRSTVNSETNLPVAAVERGVLSRMIAMLVVPPKHSRGVSIAIVLGLSIAIGSVYVLLRGTVTLQGLYLLPLILAVGWLGLGWGVCVALLTSIFRTLGDYVTAVIEPHYYFAAADLSRVISNRISGLLLFLVVVVVIHELIVITRKLEERVQARSKALQQAVAARESLQRSLFEAGVRERGTIGRDLHDGLGQHLTATAMAARILTTKLAGASDPLAADARQLEGMIKTGIDQTRRIARGLLLESVPPAELYSELQELAHIAEENHGVPCEVTTEGKVDRLDVNTASHLFYIAREALRNALRHGEASRIAIQLSVRRAWVELSIIDDGQGIVVNPERREGMGLLIMAQRAQFMGGSLRVHPPYGGGTRVDCRVPLLGEGAR